MVLIWSRVRLNAISMRYVGSYRCAFPNKSFHSYRKIREYTRQGNYHIANVDVVEFFNTFKPKHCREVSS